MTLKTVLLIVLSFNLVCSKQFTECELAKELLTKHGIPRNEVYKYLCITALGLNTDENQDGNFLGIFRIGSKWWCGKNEVGGSCALKCASLTNDDISDDVKCAKKILTDQGLGGWQEDDEDCIDEYVSKIADCFANLDVSKNENATEANLLSQQIKVA